MKSGDLIQNYGDRLKRYWAFRITQSQELDVSASRSLDRLFDQLLRQAADLSGVLRVSEDSPESSLVRKVFPSGPPELKSYAGLAHEQSLPERDLPEKRRIIGNSSALTAVLREAISLSRSTAPVLITGETGTGKELLAEFIHDQSDRRRKPLIPVNCGALTESLLESELFGHEPNAFTGAGPRGYTGRIEAANGGTLFLDEIAELPLSGQAKLLRFLDRGEIQKVGRVKPTYVDVRVICATHQDLSREVKAGRFREDLYYRVALMELELPPLRKRYDDLAELVDHFLYSFQIQYSRLQPGSVSASGMASLKTRTWPGNVRELRFTIERAFLQCHSEQIEPEHLPAAKTDGQKFNKTPLSNLEQQICQRLAEARPSLFPKREAWARFLLRQAGSPFTNRMIVAEFPMSEASARIRLNSLVDLGILEAKGVRKGRKYYLLPPFTA